MQDVFDVELRLKRNEYLMAADVKAPHRSRPRRWCPKGVPRRRRGSNRERESSPAKRAQTLRQDNARFPPLLFGSRSHSPASLPRGHARPRVLGGPTRAESDEALLKSWLRSLGSQHTQRNFEVTARRFLAELPEGGLRAATVEDVRDALTSMSTGLSEASARQYVLRIKSLLGYAHALGYTPFNAGATIKVR